MLLLKQFMIKWYKYFKVKLMIIPTNLLKNKKILLGVTGSIAVYKSLDLVRYFVKAGAEVKVVMSESAKKFITPLTFETLTSNQVLDDFNESWVDDHNHIKTTEWADLFVIAPATANTIAKLSNAIADNMLTQCALAFPKTKLIAPSANTNMLENPITKANLKLLAISNYTVINTQTKELACKTIGDGAMAEPLNIFWSSARVLLEDDFWSDRRVIVTGGGTIEKIDDIRYLSNYSSGKMASALASALYCKGADVNLIATKFEENLPEDIHTIDVENSAEMLEYLEDSIRIAKKGKLSKPSLMNTDSIKLIQKKPYLFMAAAVSDYIPEFTQSGKLKKEILGNEWELKLKKNIDILSFIDKTGIVTIGFKAEMDKKVAIHNASKMIDSKQIDAVCLNILKDSSSFGSEKNKIEFIKADKIESIPNANKLDVALDILEHAKNI